MPSVLRYLLPWDFSPTVLILCASTGVLYVRGLVARRRDHVRVGCAQPLAFFLGLALLYAVLQTYVDYLSQHMFWVHRLQHLVLHHIAPVLLVLAAPAPVLWQGLPRRWRPAARRIGASPVLARVVAIVQHPFIACLLFVGLIYFWLTPAIHFGAMLDARRYLLMNWSMAVDGVLFWWLMLSPKQAQGAAALGYGARLLVLCLAALLQILLGAYITLHKSVLFDVYGICGRAWNESPLTDQELGGLLTWIPAAMMSGVGVLIVLRHVLNEGRSEPVGLPAGTVSR